MQAALGSSEWDVVYDVSGFVMAAGGSDIDGLLDLFDGRVGDYVYVSSIMAYDQSFTGIFPWTEDLPFNPEGTASYGGFKAVAEQAMLDRHAASGFPASVVRPAAIYGPDNNIFDMEAPMFLRLLQSRPILVPHGGLVATSYGHVDDLCDVMVAMAGQPAARGEIFNITAEGLTSARYVELLADIVGAEPDVVFIPDDVLPSIERPVFGHLFGVRHHAIASIEKAERLLGFRPRYDARSGHVRDVRVVPRAGLGRPDRAAARSGLGSELGLRGGGGAGREAAVTADERPVGRPSESALWASVAETVQKVVLPALGDDPHTRQVAIHLVGLATYAGRRGPDPTPARIDELADVLDAAARAGDPLVGGRWTEGSPRTPEDVLSAAGAVLAAAAEADGTDEEARRDGLAVRDDLRMVLLRQLEEDLATEDVLLAAFRGRLPDG